MNDPTTAVMRVLRADPTLYNKTTSEELPEGYAGTDATLARMAAAAKKASQSASVRAVASAIVGQQNNRDDLGSLLGLDQFLRSTIRFKRDTLGAEVLVDPEALLHEIGLNGVTGCDCDDVATLGASIVRAMGHQPYFVVYKKSPLSQWAHVAYAVSVKGSAPIPFDPQERVRPGQWSAPPELRKVVPA